MDNSHYFMWIKNYLHRPFLLWLPFILLYAIVVGVLAPPTVVGDELRYIILSDNLTKGYYSPPFGVYLWSGPGYPMYLMPFSFLKMPLWVMRLSNVLLHYLMLVYAHKSLQALRINDKVTFVAVFLLALYPPPLLLTLPLAVTEELTMFLLVWLCFYGIQLFNSPFSHKKVLFWGIAWAFLAMVKIIYGYVITFSLFLFVILWLFKRSSAGRKKAVFTFAWALLFCVPYLIYTYSLTGRVFYWSNAGGTTLYWMSTPHEGEYGDWHNEDLNDGNDLTEEGKSLLKKHHQADMDYLTSIKDPILRDDEYKKIGINQIKQHPRKYAVNVMANVGRMLFRYPHSYRQPRLTEYAVILPNMFLVVLGSIFFPFLLWQYRKIPQGLSVQLIIMSIYFTLSAVVSAYERTFFVLVPLLVVVLAYSIGKMVKLQNIK